MQPHVHQSPSSALPSSLRHLFGDEANSLADPFRSPISQTRGTQSPQSSPTPSQSSPQTRGRGQSDRGPSEATTDDLQTARQKNFAFPPRTPAARYKSKLSSNIPDSEGEDGKGFDDKTEKPHLPPLGPGIPLGKYSAKSSPDNGTDIDESSPSHRDVLPDVEVPTALNPANPGSFDSSMVPPASLDPPPPSARSNRKRSQSSADGISSRPGFPGKLNLDLASPSAFLFPVLHSGSPTPTAMRQKTSSGASPPHTGPSSPSAHQATYSLDTFASGGRRILPQHSQAAMSRARSATALPEPPYPASAVAKLEPELQHLMLNRQRSVTVLDNTTLVAPVKPFARGQRERSGSSSSDPNISAQNLPLKDVLKARFYLLIYQCY